MASGCGFSGLRRDVAGLRQRFAKGSRAALRGLLTVSISVLVGAVACASAQAAGGTVTRTFSEERSEHSFVVPAGVDSIKVVAVGGAGGEGEAASGGFGARVEGGLSVTPGQTLYVDVGYEGNAFGPAFDNGGGSSDVRTAPRADGLSPDDRLIVAGAGGGAGEPAGEVEPEAFGGGGNAGDAEGEEGEEWLLLEGQRADLGGKGGSLTDGGSGGIFRGRGCSGNDGRAGELETGGEGGLGCAGGEGGQGGAGYYGGGGGAAGLHGAGGGGGSSLVPAGGSFSLAEPEEEPAQVQISYTQLANPPAVVTEAASELRRESAVLNATVNPEDEEVTSCRFEWGTSESFGSSAACSVSPGAGVAPVEVSAKLTELTPETTYHYRIVATNANGTSDGADQTFTTPRNEPPVVTGISPDAGPVAGGETVTISGSEFEEATAVSFGSTPAESFTVDSSESITAVSPVGTAGTVSVSVTTPSGTSSGGVHFTFLPLPVVVRVSPKMGPAAGGTSVKVLGSGFAAGSTVSFGASAARSVTFDSEKELTAVAPAGAETVFVTVTTPFAGTSVDAENGRFGYETGAPEYGRCVLGVDHLEEFTNVKCEITSSTGNYRWEPGAEKGGFTAATLPTRVVTLETVGKAIVKCASAAITGTITSRGVTGETISFKGCASGTKSCTGAGLAAGEITTSTLQGVLAWESKSEDKAVLALTPGAQPFMQYTCEGSASTTVTGSILIPVKAGKMEASSRLKLAASKGKQKPESLEDGETDVLSSSTGGGPAEQTGLKLVAEQENEEAVEVNPDV
jgi:IPT/TIG domain